jgi:hypothetical protein
MTVTKENSDMTSSSWSHLNFTAFLNSASPWDAGCTLEGPEGCRGAPRTGKAEELVRCAAEAGGVQPCTRPAPHSWACASSQTRGLRADPWGTGPVGGRPARQSWCLWVHPMSFGQNIKEPDTGLRDQFLPSPSLHALGGRQVPDTLH